MTYEAGTASVSINPDFRDFHAQIGAELSTLDEQFAKAGDSAGAKFSDAFSARVKAGLAGLPDATVKADADTAAAEAKLDEVAKKPRSATITVKAVADKVSGKTGTLADLLNPVGLGAAAGVAAGPSALGLAAGLAGIGAGFAAAAGDAGAFGVIAKGMFSDVSAAQKALTTAQQAYNKATTDKGRASALAAEKAALAGLTPAEKQLATELTALTTAWGKLQKAEQPVVGQALAPWLAAAIPGMQLLAPLVNDGAAAIGFLGSQAQAALQSPFWKTFASTFGEVGGESLITFGDAAGHVADGLAHLFVTFAPDIENLVPDVDKLAGSFDHWASSVTSGGLNNFLSTTFSPANVKTLAQDGKDLASFLENVAKSSQDMSPLAFAGVSNVLDILGSLPPGVIEAATGLFLAIKTIGTISKGVSAVSSVISGVKGLFGGAATSAADTGESAAAGTASGTAFSGGFAKGIAELPGEVTTVLAGIGEATATEANAAGDAVGADFAAGFGEGVGEVGAGLVKALGIGAPEVLTGANGAGMAVGADFAAGFGEGVGEVGTTLLASMGLEAGGLVLLGAALAGGALGFAFGTGVTGGFALSGAKNVASGLEGDVKNATSSASGWLQPAGKAAADGFGSGFLGEQSKVQSDVAQVKNWTQAGANGSGTWITPHGQQAGQGFASGFTSARNLVDSAAAQLHTWVTSSLPAPLSWLANIGISVTQGLADGMISSGSFVVSAANYLASLVPSTIKTLLGINSPAKVMIPFGSAVPEGMAVGMIGGAGFITDAGSHLADVTAASLGTLATGQALGSLGQLGIAGAPRLPGVGGQLSGAPLQLQVSWAGSGSQVTDAIVSGLQFHIQGTTGGDVQAALGLGPVR